MTIKIKAAIWLVVVTALWGFTFPLIKNVVDIINPSLFVAVRFLLAAIVLLPFILTDIRKNNFEILIAGILLGIFNSSVYVTQTIGLQTISSAQSAFIVGMNVLFIPFFAALFKLNKIAKIDVVAAIICVIGLFIFTNFAVHFQIGSFWCLLSAISIAISIVYLQSVTTKKIIKSFRLLAFYQIFFTFPIPAILSFHSGKFSYLNNPSVIIVILFCAIFATSIALVLQTKYQRHINTTKAALIYSLEPVFACLFGFIVNKEAITINMLAGGLIILSGLTLHIFAEKKIKQRVVNQIV